MNVTISKTDSTIRIVVVDILLLAAVCLVPAMSHLFAVPVYKANPMLLCMLASILLVRDRRNAFLLAVLLPLTSMIVSGMPVPMKAACMIPELITVVAVYSLLSRRTDRSGWATFGAMLLAIVAGKGVYYLLKALLISPALLVGTSLWLQIGTTVLFAAIFAIVTMLANRKDVNQ